MIKVGYLITILLLILGTGISTSAQASADSNFDPAPLEIASVAKIPRRAVTSMDLLTIRDVHGLSLSPDGKYAAFVVGQAVYETNSYRTGLFVMDVESDRLPICLGTAGLPQWDNINQWTEEAPQWSLDSQYIFRRLRIKATDNWQLWRWNRSGGPPVQVTHFKGNIQTYDVTPDGSRIVLTVERPRDPTRAERLAAHGILYDGNFFGAGNHSVVDEVLLATPPGTDTWIHEMSTGSERVATREEIESLGPWVSDLDDKLLNKSNPSLAGHRIVDAKVSPDRRTVAYRYIPENPAQFKGSVYLLFSKPVRGGTPPPFNGGNLLYYELLVEWGQ